MRTPSRRLTARRAGIGMAGLLVAGLAAVAGPTLASAQASSGGGMSDMAGMHMAKGADPSFVGNTRGWFRGETYNFHYTVPFFCREAPASGADSHCELGANFESAPARQYDPLYVVVPIGFTPKNPYTLQCPVSGSCIDHPHRIDLSRVFGSGTENALLPPHSHIVRTEFGNRPEWWDVKVVGVTSQAAWHQIVTGKSYAAIQALRNAGSTDITPNIPTNLFLYFAVQDK
jgi:hypothetical protein